MSIHTHPLTGRNSAIRMAAPVPPQKRCRPRLWVALLASSACALTSAPTAASELSTYPALVDALTTGQSVTMLLDLALCTRDGGDAPGPKVKGGARITRFLIPNGQYVAFADTHRTLDTDDRPVIEYIRYRALPDGSVTVRFARQVGASDEVTPRGQFQCSFTRGVRFMAGEAPRALPLRTRMDTPAEAPVQRGHADTQQPANGGDPDQ